MVSRETSISNIYQTLWTLTTFSQNSMTLDDYSWSHSCHKLLIFLQKTSGYESTDASLSRTLPTHSFPMLLRCGEFTVRSVKSFDPSAPHPKSFALRAFTWNLQPYVPLHHPSKTHAFRKGVSHLRSSGCLYMLCHRPQTSIILWK